jgi:hypothetical protein
MEEEQHEETTDVEELLKQRWVLEDQCRWTIFEDLEDELQYHRRRSRALCSFVRAHKALKKERDAALKDRDFFQEKGLELQDQYESLEERLNDAIGDVAYWKELSKASSETSPLGSSTQSPGQVSADHEGTATAEASDESSLAGSPSQEESPESARPHDAESPDQADGKEEQPGSSVTGSLGLSSTKGEASMAVLTQSEEMMCISSAEEEESPKASPSGGTEESNDVDLNKLPPTPTEDDGPEASSEHAAEPDTATTKLEATVDAKVDNAKRCPRPLTIWYKIFSALLTSLPLTSTACLLFLVRTCLQADNGSSKLLEMQDLRMMVSHWRAQLLRLSATSLSNS